MEIEKEINNAENQEKMRKKACKMSVYRYIGAMLVLVVALLAVSHLVQYRTTQRLKQELAGAQLHIKDASDREQGVSARYAQLQTEFALAQSKLEEVQKSMASLEAEKAEEVAVLQEAADRLQEEKDAILHVYGLLFQMEKAWRQGDTVSAGALLTALEKDGGETLLREEALLLYQEIRADLTVPAE